MQQQRAAQVVGLLCGREYSFPPAFIQRVDELGAPHGITGQMVKLGGTKMDESARYGVIVDRISHEVEYYRAFLKHAVLEGTYVINNPFWWTADDKFFNYALATKLGVAIPPTVILPHQAHPEGTTDQSMRNLMYPLNWDEIFAYVGFPAFLKPYSGGGWKHVYKVDSPDEFFHHYNQTGDLCMTLQHGVEFKEYFRCYVIGQEKVLIMPYDPKVPFHERYIKNPPAYDPKLLQRVEKDAITLCRALGYDLNTVEFAVEDGVPYAIDFMNPAPDAEATSVGQANFEWVVNAVAEMAVKKALSDEDPAQELRWASFLSGPKVAEMAAPKAAPRKKARALG